VELTAVERLVSENNAVFEVPSRTSEIFVAEA
jgi:hypothetical protein